MPPKKKVRLASVVHLATLRERRRILTYQAKISGVLEINRRALARLYSTGALFSRDGTRAGRDLLLAHQHLLKVVSLLNRLKDVGEVPAPQRPEDTEQVYRKLDALLDRTSQLTDRTGHFLARFEGE